MAETEELAEHDPGEPGENTDNTYQGVGMLQWWFFLSGVRTRRSKHYFVCTDIHRAGYGDASIVVLSLWSESSAKLTLFCVHGYVASSFPKVAA